MDELRSAWRRTETKNSCTGKFGTTKESGRPLGRVRPDPDLDDADIAFLRGPDLPSADARHTPLSESLLAILAGAPFPETKEAVLRMFVERNEAAPDKAKRLHRDAAFVCLAATQAVFWTFTYP